MKAKLTLKGDITVVDLIGRMEVESASYFKKACETEFVQKKLVFNLKNVSFVGSNGIVPCLDSLKGLAAVNSNVKICGVSQDMKRMFDACDLSHLEFFSDDVEALKSFQSEVR